MPALASHRKPRSSTTRTFGSFGTFGTNSPAVGVTTAAIASVTTLLSAQSAEAAPGRPTVEEVQRKIDDLYRQAGGTGTQAQRYAQPVRPAPPAQPVRPAQPVEPAPPSPYVPHIEAEPTARPDNDAVEAAEAWKAEIPAPRAEPAKTPEALRAGKRTVQRKLAEAHALLAREETRTETLSETPTGTPTGTRAEAPAYGPEARGTENGTGHGPDRTAAEADKVLAFARAQLGKPYVWGAAGPSSYDCSGLTQAAWKAAGVDLPRTTWEQARVGTRVSMDELRPGDLVFFYDDISHVGVYQGDGVMIHAPRPGMNVREDAVHSMPLYGCVRPA
ncbi:NlpC/P60 family protein [Streptomyces sp. NPDC045431]|uniref:C40 family peptidase n=1 Tax=Streptomyces sp. NPDC045431 TaxID=3155613 RepID=UPI0033C3A697